jgi:CheY-like chemotaxis protein
VGNSKPILLVEDSEDDVFFMQRALKDAGIDSPLQVVEDGEMAINYFMGKGKFADRAQFPLPDLVLLDLKLPKVMGLDVLKCMRANAALPPILVIVLSASSERADIEGAYRHGANSYLIKPSTPDRLLAMVKSLGDYWFRWNTRPPS